MDKIKTYDVWFQDGHIMFTVRALDSQAARRLANKYISIKEQKEVRNLSNKSPEQPKEGEGT